MELLHYRCHDGDGASSTLCCYCAYYDAGADGDVVRNLRHVDRQTYQSSSPVRCFHEYPVPSWHCCDHYRDSQQQQHHDDDYDDYDGHDGHVLYYCCVYYCGDYDDDRDLQLGHCCVQTLHLQSCVSLLHDLHVAYYSHCDYGLNSLAAFQCFGLKSSDQLSAMIYCYHADCDGCGDYGGCDCDCHPEVEAGPLGEVGQREEGVGCSDHCCAYDYHQHLHPHPHVFYCCCDPLHP